VFEEIKKRNGRVVEFNSTKITAAVIKAGKATGEFKEKEAKKLCFGFAGNRRFLLYIL